MGNYYKKDDYKFIGFSISHLKDKKYDAILKNRETGKIVHVPFGAKGYSQYKDRALGYYSQFDHLDKKRRRSYQVRHAADINKPYSASWFSLNYLW